MIISLYFIRTLFQEYQRSPSLNFGNHIWLGKEIALKPNYTESIKGMDIEDTWILCQLTQIANMDLN